MTAFHQHKTLTRLFEQLLAKELTEEEVECVANASYAYWYVTNHASDKMPENGRINAAAKEIRRHFVGEGRKHHAALSAIREALSYRKVSFYSNQFSLISCQDASYNFTTVRSNTTSICFVHCFTHP